MSLLHVPMCLGLPLLGGSELRAHISSQPGLLGKAVPFRLLLMKEPGLVPSMSNNILKGGPKLEDTKTQKYVKKEENKREDQADIRLEGVWISHKALVASFKAFNAAENPMSRFSHSRLSVASSSENRADDGSSAAIH